MLVYRVEDSRRVGPYRNTTGSISRLNFNRHNSEKRPGFRQCHILSSYSLSKLKPYICGFKSITQFKKWFIKKDREWLEFKGYKLVVYESDDIILASNQLVFRRKTAIKKEVITITKDM